MKKKVIQDFSLAVIMLVIYKNIIIYKYSLCPRCTCEHLSRLGTWIHDKKIGRNKTTIRWTSLTTNNTNPMILIFKSLSFIKVLFCGERLNQFK